MTHPTTLNDYLAQPTPADGLQSRVEAGSGVAWWVRVEEVAEGLGGANLGVWEVEQC